MVNCYKEMKFCAVMLRPLEFISHPFLGKIFFKGWTMKYHYPFSMFRDLLEKFRATQAGMLDPNKNEFNITEQNLY